MKIYSMQKCEKWLKRKTYYPASIKILTFAPKKEDNRTHILTRQDADVDYKMFST